MPDGQDAETPVFVCGLGRSGTTWLASRLGQSPQLRYIHEAWLVHKLEELAGWFEMIHDDWSDFTPWKDSGVDRKVFVDSLARWYRELLGLAADGKRPVEKTPDLNVHHLPFLAELFPDAHYVLLHRDGRNVVASQEAKNARQGEPYDFEVDCRRWASGMDVFAEVCAAGGLRHAMLVRYEDLVEDFDARFEDVCTFVGIPAFRPAPGTINSSFDDAAHGDGDHNGRWRSWSPEKLETFERLAGRQLAEWGYARSTRA